jgi:hypothetical protein
MEAAILGTLPGENNNHGHNNRYHNDFRKVL